ncbi:MAG: MBL fold metallo-hydrolase [Pseudomonadota bacterium]
MAYDWSAGDIAYGGYPTSHVFNFKRTSKGELKLSRLKHLLWGDWIKVTDYSYADDPEADIRTDGEAALVAETGETLVPVRVRGVDGYMEPADLQKERLLEIVFVDVGQGDGALVVLPDDRKLVVDAGAGDNMYRYLNWRFAGFKKSNTDFDGIIVTHPDLDHYAGFQELFDNEDVSAKRVWHNGLVEQFGVSAAGAQSSSSAKLLGDTEVENGQRYLTGLVETDEALAVLLADENRWVKKSTRNPKRYPKLLHTAQSAKKPNGKRRFEKIEMLSIAHGEFSDGKTYVPGFAPKPSRGFDIQILGPAVEMGDGAPRLPTFTSKPQEKTTTLNTGKTKNGHSVLLKLHYRDLRLLFGGDLNAPAEMYLLNHYTGLPVHDRNDAPEDVVVNAAREVFHADVSKCCHHGSADFVDMFMETVNPVATVVSSGDQEGHAHPRSDTLGAIGRNGRGRRSLIFSTELARSTREFTDREDTPWYKAVKLEAKADKETDPEKKAEMLKEVEQLKEWDRTNNVTVYGSINLRSDGRKVVMAYMLERPSASRRWDVYTLESVGGGPLSYVPVKEAEKREEERRRAAAENEGSDH